MLIQAEMQREGRHVAWCSHLGSLWLQRRRVWKRYSTPPLPATVPLNFTP